MRIKERLQQIGKKLSTDRFNNKKWRRRRRSYKRWKRAKKNVWGRRLQGVGGRLLSHWPIKVIAGLGVISIVVGWLLLVGLTLSKINHFYGGGQDLYLAGTTIALMAEGTLGVALAGASR